MYIVSTAILLFIHSVGLVPVQLETTDLYLCRDLLTWTGSVSTFHHLESMLLYHYDIPYFFFTSFKMKHPTCVHMN